MTTLLEEIEAHLEATGTAPATFGRAAMGDPTFVSGLRKGRDYRASTVKKIRKYIASVQSEPPCIEHGAQEEQTP